MKSIPEPEEALRAIQQQAARMGFDQLGVLDVSRPHPALEEAGNHLKQWVQAHFHGSMSYMTRHGEKRWRPDLLHPGTISVISLRMPYLNNHQGLEALNDPHTAYISRYALGRDYHKTFRQALTRLARWIDDHFKLNTSGYQSRGFVDSAPLMEKATAQAAGLGWIGKHTLVLDRKAGSWFFLGEVLTNIALPSSQPQLIQNHCGTCTRCMDVCPTQAIVAPYQLDARRCISYLTIENKSAIPVEFRTAIGNRVFGCDDCQLYCPWNRFAQTQVHPDFKTRHGLDQLQLINALQWSESEFHALTQGSALRRTGYWGWLRNLAVAAGNHPKDAFLVRILQQRRQTLEQQATLEVNQQHTSSISMVIEHLDWAIRQQKAKT